MSTTKEEIYQLLSAVPEYIKMIQCDTNYRTIPFKCAVKSCPNRFLTLNKNEELPYKFHMFPVEKKLRKLWKIKCGWGKYDHMKGLMVCSDHFNPDDYIRNFKEEFVNPNFKRQLNKLAVPKLNLGLNQDKEFNASDNDYETDTECMESIVTNANKVRVPKHQHTQKILKDLVGFPKEYYTPVKDIPLGEGPLDLDEVKQEVDLNTELENQNKELQSEIRVCENRINTLNKKIRSAQAKVRIVHKRNQEEREILEQHFTTAQINLLLGKKAVWTDNDMATAFTIRHMGSKKCYLYLKNTLKMPLPALSCVQKWAATRAQDKNLGK